MSSRSCSVLPSTIGIANATLCMRVPLVGGTERLAVSLGDRGETSHKCMRLLSTGLRAGEARGQRCSRRDVELLKRVTQVAAHCVRRDEQALADLAVGQPLGDQLRDRALASGQ